jgi:cell division septum initiation protein DivIVA
MDFRRRILTVVLGATLALAACGDDAEDQVRDAGDQLQTEAEQLRTEAEDLGDSLDSEGERDARVRKLERRLKELRREGSDRADDVRREIEELLER